MVLNLYFFLVISSLLFFIGFFGIILNKRDIISVLFCIELIVLAVNLNFIFFSVFLDDAFGQVFALFVLAVAAAESAIGLAVLVVYYRIHFNLSISTVNLLHGLSSKKR
jgi:NADH-quinone oxidoreductase subunit K